MGRPRIYVSDWTGMLWKKLLINPCSMTMKLACLRLEGGGRVDTVYFLRLLVLVDVHVSWLDE